MSTIAATLPNPDTYLSYPTQAQMTPFEVGRSIYFAVLGAFIWDILVYVPDDITILRRGIRTVTGAFVFSRVFAVTYLLLCVIQTTTPVVHCHALGLAKGTSALLTISLSAYLFLRRVQAVYSDAAYVQRAFFVLWLATTCFMICIPVGLQVIHVPVTQYCVDSAVAPYVALSALSIVFFDTLVLLAISYKIISTHSIIDPGERMGLGALLSGKALPRLSRAVLQGGQQYYLITVGAYTFQVILVFVPSVPPAYKTILSTPPLTLGVSMACRVLRNISMLDIEERTLPRVSSIRFRGDMNPA